MSRRKYGFSPRKRNGYGNIMGRSSFPGKKPLNTSLIITLAIVGVIIMLFKPLKDFIMNLFSGITNAGSTIGNALGISDTKDTKAVISAGSDPGSPWSPNFSKKAPAGTVLMTIAGCDNFLNSLYGCVGWFFDDFDTVLALFKTLKTQSQLSFIADRLQATKGIDLLASLQNKTWFDVSSHLSLSDAQIAQLNSYIIKLPKYK